MVGHPEVIHFICRAEPPGDQRLGFFRRPDWRRICRCFLAASIFPSLSPSDLSVSHCGSTNSCSEPKIGTKTSEVKMRNIIFAINITLDGCCDHTKMIADEEIHEYFTQLMRDFDLLVFGRKTHQLMVPFWPDVAKTILRQKQ